MMDRVPFRAGSVLVAGLLALMVAPGGASAQISNDVIRIGVLNDQSGPYSDIGGRGSVLAVQLAIEDAGGAPKGAKIEVIDADHQNKPDVASNIAREWIDQRQVDVIVDGAASSAGLAIQSVTRDKKRLFLISGPAAADFTGKQCSPYGLQWTYDTYALAKGTGGAMVKQGGDTWFFMTADYAFGHALEADTSAFVKAAGGKVLGSVRHPLNTQDFSSFLLQAQASKAKIIGFANAGTDFSNAMKQAAEFGIVAGGQRIAGLLVMLPDVHALGLKAAQGLVFTEAYYWDMDEETRALAKRFMAKSNGRPPSQVQAGVYSAVLNYLKAVQATGTDDSDKVRAQLGGMKIHDAAMRNGSIRADGRVVHDMYLFQAKAPSESKHDWDYYKLLATIPAAEAWRPISESECPLVKK